MPQKAFLSRAPLVRPLHSALTNGTVRSDMNELHLLYRHLEGSIDHPVSWEGLFSLACLLKDRPAEEPVFRRIMDALAETEDGSLPGSFGEQLSAARAALSVYEYNTDRNVLKRLARWCRFTEAEWDAVSGHRMIRIQPADLMEFLIRFYLITGLKGVLRLCVRLRSAALDWTTILQQFRQRQPLDLPEMKEETAALFAAGDYRDIDFPSVQYLSNHAEILADSVRYTAYSALFSGNGQELTAGRKAWDFLSHAHSAVCGGTTANVFLGGDRTSQGIHTGAAAAWVEAMAAQAMISAEPWAMNELTVLVFNALSDCLRNPEGSGFRFVNIVSAASSARGFDPEAGERRNVVLLSRLARAASAAYRNAVTVSDSALFLNYLLPGRYSVSVSGSTLVIQADDHSAVFRTKSGVSVELNLFCSADETADILLKGAGNSEQVSLSDRLVPGSGGRIRISREWKNMDTILFRQGDRVIVRDIHHRGKAVFVRNRLMVLDVRDTDYRYALAGAPRFQDGKVFCPFRRLTRWPNSDGIPDDIPVLPAGTGEIHDIPLYPYAMTPCRISAFPVDRQYD